MKWLIGVAALVVASSGFVRTQSETGAPAWDLDAIYPTEVAWLGEARVVESAIERLHALSVMPLTSPERLRQVLDAMTDARARSGRMAKVGLLQSQVDTASEAATARRTRAFELERHTEVAIAPLERAIGALNPSRLARWRRADAGLRRHDRRLRRIAHAAALAPGPGREEFVTRLALLARRAADTYERVLRLKQAWPVVDTPGGPQAVTPASFPSLRRSVDRATRHAAHQRYLTTLGDMRELFGGMLLDRLEADWLSVRERGLSDPIEALFMLADGTPPGTASTLLQAARRQRAVLARATRALAGSATGRGDLADAFAQSADLATLTLDEARALAVAAAEPLGRPYQDLLRSRFLLPWWHLSLDARKSGTVGTFWQVGDGHPHVLLSFGGRHANSRTFTAAAFLAMAYAAIPTDQAPDRRDEDLPIFGNAIWYFGQLRHDDVRARHAPGKPLAQAVAHEQLYAVWNAYVRGVVLVAFETELCSRVRRGIRPTGRDISQLYLATLREFVGGPEGVDVPDYFGDEWITADTLFYGPYQATFPIAMAMAVALRERVINHDTKAIETVRSGIARSASHYSYEILAEADLDPLRVRSYDPVVTWLANMPFAAR